MPIEIVETQNDALLCRFFHQHWLDMGVTEDEIAEDWREQALAFIAAARRDRRFTAFAALLDGEPIGGASCQLMDRAYPAFRKSDARKIGYVWGVYVSTDHRGGGLGAALVGACVTHLTALGCQRVVLHAAEKAAPLYRRLGFERTAEHALTIKRGEIA